MSAKRGTTLIATISAPINIVVSNTCAPETNAGFCSRLNSTYQNKICGTVSALDNCGVQRNNIVCGSCNPPETCGAVNLNTCGIIAQCTPPDSQCSITTNAYNRTCNTNNQWSTTWNLCPQPTSSCQVAGCTTNAKSCLLTNVLESLQCSANNTCASGACVCDQDLCKNNNKLDFKYNTYQQIGCLNFTKPVYDYTEYSCQSSSCSFYQTTHNVQGPNSSVLLSNGQSCTTEDDKAGRCSSVGSCVANQCTIDADCASDACMASTCVAGQCKSILRNQSAICKNAAFDELWNSNLSICNSQIIVCNGQVFCSAEISNKTVTNHACSITTPKLTAGYCEVISGSYKCLPNCPSIEAPGCKLPSEVANNTAINNVDYSCPTDNACYVCNPSYYLFDAQTRNCYPATGTVSFDVHDVHVGEYLTIQPDTRDESGNPIGSLSYYKLSYAGTDLEDNKGFRIALQEPGIYSITITAYSGGSSSRAIGKSTKDLVVLCDPAKECCKGSSWKTDGSTCRQDNIDGFCKSHECQTACIRNAPTETGIYQDKNRCNNGIDDNCDGTIDCDDSSCFAFCKNNRCKQGTIYCTNACIDAKTDSSNCGYCGTLCKPNDEQCIDGACTKVDNCNIKCSVDAECPTSYVCINPGDCKKSYCAPTNVMVANETKTNEIAQLIIDGKTYTVIKEIFGNRIRIIIKNMALEPLQNVSVTVALNLPKDILSSASELSSQSMYTAQEDNETIFLIFAPFEQISSSQEIVIDLPQAIDPGFISLVNVAVSHNKLSGITSALQDDQLTITNNLIKEDGKTKLRIGLDPHADLRGVRVPVQIPKCVAASASELNLQGNYEIIQDDPLVVWTFDAISTKENIDIDLGTREIAEDCRSGITALAVASNVNKPLNPWIPLALIPIIGFVIIFFQKFRAGDVKERLGKEEFERLASEEGQTKEQIEESWKDYERKF